MVRPGAQRIDKMVMDYLEQQQGNAEITTTALEDAINIKGWAGWVRGDFDKSCGYASSIWHKMVTTAGFRKSKVYYPITEDYAIKLDMLIAGTKAEDPRWTNVLVGLYVRELSFRDMAFAAHCDKNQIASIRDMALTYLYGRLKSA